MDRRAAEGHAPGPLNGAEQPLASEASPAGGAVHTGGRAGAVWPAARLLRADGWQGYLFVAPAWLLFALFVLAPLASSLYYGFTRWDGISPPRWVGLANFREALRDTVYLRAYLHNFTYIALTLVVEVAYGLAMAILLRHEWRGFSLMRVLFFSPVVLSWVAAGLLWSLVYDYELGPLNNLLRAVGLDRWARPWLSDPSTALVAVTLVSGWKYSGFYMVVFLAALKRIPRSLYEAALVDGAGPTRQLFSITLPLLRSTVNTALLICVTGGFAAFDLFFTMTDGQPYHATEIPTTWIIKEAFDRNNLGYGVALTVLMTLVVVAFSTAYLIHVRRHERVEY